jgi:hypothetical protein
MPDVSACAMTARRPSMRSRESYSRWALVLIACTLAGLHGWSLLRHPPVFVDEAWVASRAWALATRDELTGTLDSGVVDLFPRGWAVFPVVPVFLQSATYVWADSPTLLPLRMLSLTAGACLLVAVWSIGHSVGGSRTAALAVLLVGLSRPFLYSSHSGRYDVMAAAAGFAAIALFVRGRRDRMVTAAMAGFCAAAAVEIHPFAAVIAIALPVLAVHEFGVRVLRTTFGRSLITGLAFGAFIWAAIHIGSDVSGYSQIGRIIYGPSHVPRASEWLTGIRDTAMLVWDAQWVTSLVAASAVVILARSPHHDERRLSIVAVTILAAFALLVRNKMFYYEILVTPALDIAIAAVSVKAFETIRLTRTTAAGVWLALAAVTLSWTVSVTVSQLAVDHFSVYERVQARVARTITATDRIIGSQTYWFGLYRNDYRSWEQLVFLQRLRPGRTMTDALNALCPDVLIRDGQMDSFISDSAGPTVYSRLLRLPRRELNSWLAVNASVADDFDGKGYGRVRVYRIHTQCEVTGAVPPAGPASGSAGPSR